MATREISITKMPNAELVRLINIASAELARRMAVPLPELPPGMPEPPRTVPVTIREQEPSEDEKEFCLHVAQRLRGGGYIKADERRRVAEIAEKFPEWVRRQRLPAVRGTGPWRAAQEMHRVGFAPER